MGLTCEQEHVAETLLKHNAVHVMACAGSGKTTVILHAAERLFKETGQKSILLAYNVNLQYEVTQKLKRKYPNIDNRPIEHVCTAHSFCHRFFVNPNGSRVVKPGTNKPLVCTNDIVMHEFVSNPRLVANFNFTRNIGCLIFDEAQDLNELLVQLLKRAYKELYRRNPKIKCLLTGDLRQTIYQFRRSEAKYLQDPDTHIYRSIAKDLNVDPIRSVPCALTRTFRPLNRHLSDAVQMLSNPRDIELFWNIPKQTQFKDAKDTYLVGSDVKYTEPVRFIDIQNFTTFQPGHGKIYHHHQFNLTVQDILRRLKLKQSQIMSLALSVANGNAWVIRLHNFLNRKFDIEFCDNTTSSRLQHNKQLLCSTIHSSKGLERDMVILFALSGYHELREFELSRYRGRVHDPFVIDNLMHVGLTRARKYMIVVWNSADPYSTFVNLRRGLRCRIWANLHNEPSIRRHVSVNKLAYNANPLIEQCRLDSWCDVKTGFVEGVEALNCDVGERFIVKDPESSVQNNFSNLVGMACEYYLLDLLNIENPSNGIFDKVQCHLQTLSSSDVSKSRIPVKFFLNTADSSFLTFLKQACLREAHTFTYRNYYINRRWLSQTQSSIRSIADVLTASSGVLRTTFMTFLKQVLDIDISNHDIKAAIPLRTNWFIQGRDRGIDIKLSGELDFLINGNVILELKFASSITYDFIYQTALYMLVWRHCFPARQKVDRAYVFNLNSGQYVCITVDEKLDSKEILNAILSNEFK